MNNDKPVFSGLFLPHLKTAEEVREAIAVAQANGASGVSFFGKLSEEYLDVLKG